ncbi:hypothetical protein FJV41_28880, partial [Myxococcus llanfairpwllgwyngyllgogerychwyrndrobwllllantysiliogogogochensis]
MVMVVLMGATSAWADEPPVEALVPPPRTGWRVQGLPLLNFNSDEGFGYGARLLLVDAGDGTYRPYRHSLIAQFFQTTRGVATHRLMMDSPRFFDSDWRLGLDLSFINERFSPYFGQGAAAGYEPDFARCDDREQLEDAQDVCAGNPSFRGLRYYSFEQRTLPSVVFNARRTLRGPLQVSVGYRFRLTRIRSRYSAKDLGQSRDSRLEEDARAGLLTGLEAGG